MHSAAQAAHGYRVVQLQTGSARGAEARLFAEITAALVGARRAGAAGFRELAEALHRNRLLWDTLLADLVLESNTLPKPLRAQLIQLGHFVRSYSARVLQGTDDVQTLIDINQAILAGLSGLTEGGKEPHGRPQAEAATG